MADHDDVFVGVKFAVGARWHIRHWQRNATLYVRDLEFPRLAHINEPDGKLLVELSLELFGGNFEFHGRMDTLSATGQVLDARYWADAPCPEP